MDGGCAHACTYTHTYVQPALGPHALVPFLERFLLSTVLTPAWPSEALSSCRPRSLHPGAPLAYMVPDLSAELLGKSFSVGVTAGLPTPELLLLLERCCTTGRTGRIGGGRS